MKTFKINSSAGINYLKNVSLGLLWLIIGNSICNAQPDSLIRFSSIKTVSTLAHKLEISGRPANPAEFNEQTSDFCDSIQLSGESHGFVQLTSWEYPNDYWQKVEFDTLKVNVKLVPKYRNEDNYYIYYTIPKRNGSILFTGKATYKNFGSFEEFEFDAGKTFNHEVDNGIIKYSKKESKVIYINFWLSKNSEYNPPLTAYPNAYNFTWEPDSVSINFEFPSVWWFKPPYDVFDVPDVKIECYSPVADFTYGDAGKIINNKWSIAYNFINKSSPGIGQTITEYLWDFGDGKTSTEKNPVHTFDKAGNYTISLSVKNSAGKTDKKTVENCISDLGFRPFLNGWNYLNYGPEMWPQVHWNQFNYKVLFGTDPTWNSIFPYSFPPNYVFPDFLLFAEAYGYDYCYINSVTTRISIEKWLSVIGGDGRWGGSCYGFSTSALLFFDEHFNLNSVFKGYDYLFQVDDLQLSKARNMINKYQIYQSDRNIQDNRENNQITPVSGTINSIRNSFTNTKQNKVLSFWWKDNLKKWHGHSVVPYCILTNPANTDIMNLYVYDSSQGNADRKTRISINLKDNSYYYPVKQITWHNDFITELPVDYALNQPILKSAEINNNFSIFNSVHNDLQISKANEVLGYYKDSLYKSVSFGYPLIIIEEFNPNPRPRGYYVDSGDYKAFLDKFESDTTGFSVYTDTLNYFYKRYDASIDQKDVLYFGPDYFKVVNSDNKKKSFNFMCIFNKPQNEKVLEFNKVEINPQDTISFYFSNSNSVSIRTSKSPTVYYFRTNILTQSLADFYPEKKISIDTRTTQIFVPFWDNILNKGVVLKTDNGSNGTIDKTINLNDITGISVFKEKLLVSVYPNPSSGVFKIECGEAVSKAIVSVFDVHGREIATSQITDQYGKWKTEVNITSYPKGVYLLRIVTEKKIFEKKLIRN
jgi:PKD repeat protein